MNLILSPDDINFDAWMADTDVQHKVKCPTHWEADLNDEFLDQGEGVKHPRLPWSRMANKIALRPGEVSVWIGFNGHGKSLLLGQVVLSLCTQGERCCVASFEMRPRKTLARMARQFADVAQPDPEQVRDFVRWAQGRLAAIAGRVSGCGAASAMAATSTPPLSSSNATCRLSGPLPAISTRWPAATPYERASVCMAPVVITPGSVQPGIGSGRSMAPVATIRWRARTMAATPWVKTEMSN